MTNETFDSAAQRRDAELGRDAEPGRDAALDGTAGRAGGRGTPDAADASAARTGAADTGVTGSGATGSGTAGTGRSGAGTTGTTSTGAAATGTGATTSADATSSAPEPTRIRLDPKLDEQHRGSISGATWVALILGTVVLILLLIFILQNNVPAQFAYFGWEFSLPLGVAMLFAAIAGVLITALLGSVRLFKLGRRVRHLEKERLAIKKAIR